MSLATFIDGVDTAEKHLRVYNYDGPDSVVGDIASYFAITDENVTQTEHETKPNSSVTVYAGPEELVSTPIRALWRAVVTNAEILINVRPGEPSPSDLIEWSDDTTFAAHDKRQLVTASRHIERRAQRVRGGTLHASFQRLSRLEADLTTLTYYNVLGNAGVEVHVYGLPDQQPAHTEAVNVHGIEDEEIATTWLVAYDGGGDEAEKAAMIAQEHSAGCFAGFWTFESALVDTIIEYLNRTYLS